MHLILPDFAFHCKIEMLYILFCKIEMLYSTEAS